MPKRATPSRQRVRHHRYRYGLEPKDYYQMVLDQHNLCYCCSKPGGETKGTKLYIDHNHTTGKVRKLLCSRCNQIAGAIEDKKFSIVQKYLEEHQE